ncbi:MAG: sugar phosphate isomerase/epimerase, partial [Deltaproteobacteria bacterium]|nr:sugar phosphate isomerase/epimerase [Deltaproteobacteria bacterium]
HMSDIQSMEVRFHCPFYKIDLGHEDPSKAKAADAIFRRIIRLVAKAGGKYVTMHIGLGRTSTEPLSWERTVDNFTRLVQHAAGQGVKICLENLVSGWTSRPDLFEKLIRRSGAGVTVDIGHAYASESIRSHHYSFEDFVTPHPDLIFNAHVYHTEIAGVGHVPPANLGDIEDRLRLLQEIGCEWWVLEVKDQKGLLQTRKIVDEYLVQADHQDKSPTRGGLPGFTSDSVG